MERKYCIFRELFLLNMWETKPGGNRKCGWSYGSEEGIHLLVVCKLEQAAAKIYKMKVNAWLVQFETGFWHQRMCSLSFSWTSWKRKESIVGKKLRKVWVWSETSCQGLKVRNRYNFWTPHAKCVPLCGQNCLWWWCGWSWSMTICNKWIVQWHSDKSSGVSHS